MELFSVIIPVYNAEKYIKQCINSVLKQTYGNFELILINDGSRDGSGEICEEYGKIDSRVIVIHQENAGVSVARNRGIQEARGEYLVFIDSDDYVDNKMLEVLCDRFGMGNSGMIICGMKFVYYSSEIIRSWREEVFPYDGDFNDFSLCKNFQEMFNSNAFSSSCNKAFRTKIIKENNILFHEELDLYEDLEFVLRYLKYIEKINFVNDVLYNYRNDLDHSHSKHRNADNFHRIDFIATALINLNYQKEKQTNMRLKGLSTIIYSVYLYAMSINLSSGKYSLSKVRSMVNALNENEIVKKYRMEEICFNYHFKMMDMCIRRKQALILIIWNKIIDLRRKKVLRQARYLI